MNSERNIRIVVAIVCFCLLAMPLLFLFARPGAAPGNDEFSWIYSTLKKLFGEGLARLTFCGLWLALDAALVWRLLRSKRKDNDMSPIDGLGD